jgi:hypothetical protein
MKYVWNFRHEDVKKSASTSGNGVVVTPAVYLINFLPLYISNPNEATNMPAYRTPIPADLSDCLEGYERDVPGVVPLMPQTGSRR